LVEASSVNARFGLGKRRPISKMSKRGPISKMDKRGPISKVFYFHFLVDFIMWPSFLSLRACNSTNLWQGFNQCVVLYLSQFVVLWKPSMCSCCHANLVRVTELGCDPETMVVSSFANNLPCSPVTKAICGLLTKFYKWWFCDQSNMFVFEVLWPRKLLVLWLN
jgi:hypothetical protein